MRIHTYLTENEIRLALMTAKRKGKVADDVRFDPIAHHGSRSHEHAWEAQLGSSQCGNLPDHYVNMYGKRQKTRRVRNGGYGEYRYAATWHEWGWFLAEVFDMDPAAIVGNGREAYRGQEDFDQKTKWKFVEDTPARESGLPYIPAHP